MGEHTAGFYKPLQPLKRNNKYPYESTCTWTHSWDHTSMFDGCHLSISPSLPQICLFPLPTVSLRTPSSFYHSSFHVPTGEGVLELTIIRGRNLVPKDSNGSSYTWHYYWSVHVWLNFDLWPVSLGLSDPYIVVKYGSETQFSTKVKKKTLNPEWNESTTLPSPQKDVIVNLVS